MKWTTEIRKISQIKPAGYNPRVLTTKAEKQLTASIEKFGVAENLVINKDGTLIGGHQRYKVLKKMHGADFEVQVLVPEKKLNRKDEQELNLRLNKNVGEFDYDKFFGLDALEYEDFSSIGFEEADIDFLSPVSEETEMLDDVVPVTTKNTVVITQPGDYYDFDGNHRVVCGDSLNMENIELATKKKQVDMTFTDPPYNVDYAGGVNGKRKKIDNDHMDRGDFYHFLYKVCENIFEKTDGVVYICMASSEIDNLKFAFEESGGHFSNFVIWAKNTFTLGRGDYQHQFEPIIYGWRKGFKNHYFNGGRNQGNVWEEISDAKMEFDGEYTSIKFSGFEVKVKGEVGEGMVKKRRQKTDLWRFDKPTRSKEHPTMKPVELCERAIKNSCPTKGTVLDIFLGSGSTLIAAEKIGRKCCGTELDPMYVDVIVRRYINYVRSKGKEPVIKRNGEIIKNALFDAEEE